MNISIASAVNEFAVKECELASVLRAVGHIGSARGAAKRSGQAAAAGLGESV